MIDLEAPTPAGPSGADAFVASAAASGVRTIWFTSGSELVPIQEAVLHAQAERRPTPDIVTAVHEHVGLCQAMGASMISGEPSCVAAHSDLGLLNFGGAIHNASVGGYPVLIVSGYPATSPQERTTPVFWKQQRSDQGEIVRQYVKWDYRPGVHEDLGTATARALQLALAPPAGPVYLALPSEAISGPTAVAPSGVGAQDLGIPQLGSGPDDAVIDIARRLLEADRPLVLTDRVGRDNLATECLATLAAEFGIGVAATRHRMNLPDDSPASVAPALEQADVVLVLDFAVPWVPAHNSPAPSAFVAVVGPDPAAAGIPLYEFAADIRLCADLGRFLAALGETMRRLSTADQRERHGRRWDEMQREKERRGRARAGQLAADRAGRVPTPLSIAAALNSVMDPDDLFAWELADADAVHRIRTGTMFEKGGSSLGWAVAALTGARHLDTARPAVCLTGDGSYIFGISQALLWSQQHLDCPVLTVVCNNRGYRTGTESLVERYPNGFAARTGSFPGGTFDPPPDFAAEARAAGGFGARVNDLIELDETLAAARAAVERERRPAVVDVWLPAHVTGAHPLRGASVGPNAQSGTKRP